MGQITKRTPRAQYNDLPYGIAFALNYIAIIGLAVVYYRPLDQIEDTSDDSESNVHIDKSVLLGAGAAAAAGVCKAAHLGRSYLLSVDDGCCSNVGDLCRSSIYGNVLCIILCDSNRILLLCAASHQTRSGND